MADQADSQESPLRGDIVRGTADNLGTLPEAEITQLVEAMSRGMPWATAIAQPGLPVTRTKKYWFTECAKATFYVELDTPGRAWALEIGPGSGVISACLAARFQHVVALERHPLWCRFMRYRFSQDSLNGARPVRGDGLALPVRDDRFDLVVVNGVMEWVPDTAPAEHPRAAQLRFLRGIYPKLRSGGVLAIGIENRLFWGNFLGFSPHGEPPYAVILPRPLADWRSRRALGKPYRSWIYGYKGYHRLLREAGFRDVHVCAALPTYHNPEAAIELGDAPAVRRFFGGTRGWKAVALGTLSRLGLLGYLVHSFYVTARR